MHSASQQILKNHATTVAGLFDRWDVCPSYRRRFEPYIETFGRENLRLMPYEQGGIQRLAAFMGLPADLEFRVENHSVSRWAVKMLAALKPFNDRADAIAALGRIVAVDRGTFERAEAPIELIEHVAGQIEDDRAWLEGIWTPPAGFFDEPPPTVPRSYYETFSTEEAQILSSLASLTRA